MPKSTAAANAIIDLIYSATTWANVAVNATSSPLTAIFIALHESSPTAGGTGQNENETDYTNYVRQSTARSTGWDAAAGGETANAGQINFPSMRRNGRNLDPCFNGSGVFRNGRRLPLWRVKFTLAVANGITPQFAVGALTVTES